MTKSKIIFAAFILLAVVQLFVPAKMILNQEKVISDGAEYKFETAPVDPNDPFRGKYITLNFINNHLDVEKGSEWREGETVYVLFENDAQGFAQIASILKTRPEHRQDYLKTKIETVIKKEHGNEIMVSYPFTRFYMKESKAPAAEQTYASSQNEADLNASALVALREGDHVLKDVLINDVPIKEWLRTHAPDSIQEGN